MSHRSAHQRGPVKSACTNTAAASKMGPAETAVEGGADLDLGAPREEMRSTAPNPETFHLRLWVQPASRGAHAPERWTRAGSNSLSPASWLQTRGPTLAPGTAAAGPFTKYCPFHLSPAPRHPHSPWPLPSLGALLIPAFPSLPEPSPEWALRSCPPHPVPQLETQGHLPSQTLASHLGPPSPVPCCLSQLDYCITWRIAVARCP